VVYAWNNIYQFHIYNSIYFIDECPKFSWLSNPYSETKHEKMRSTVSVKFLPKNRGCATCESHIYFALFFDLQFRYIVHATIILTKQYSNIGNFLEQSIFCIWELGISMLIIRHPGSFDQRSLFSHIYLKKRKHIRYVIGVS